MAMYSICCIIYYVINVWQFIFVNFYGTIIRKYPRSSLSGIILPYLLTRSKTLIWLLKYFIKNTKFIYMTGKNTNYTWLIIFSISLPIIHLNPIIKLFERRLWKLNAKNIASGAFSCAKFFSHSSVTTLNNTGYHAIQ